MTKTRPVRVRTLTRIAKTAGLAAVLGASTSALAAVPPAAPAAESPTSASARPDGFYLGVRRRPAQAPPTSAAAPPAPRPAAAEPDPLQQQVAAAMDAQAGPKSKWSDLSKTTRVWIIVGGALTAAIIIAAMN